MADKNTLIIRMYCVSLQRKEGTRQGYELNTNLQNKTKQFKVSIRLCTSGIIKIKENMLSTYFSTKHVNETYICNYYMTSLF